MSQKMWRVFFMVYANKIADTNTNMHLKAFLRTLLTSTLSPVHSYLLLINFIETDQKKFSVRKDWCVFYELKNRPDGKVVLKKVSIVYTEKIFFKTTFLSNAINEILPCYPAAKTLFVTWDHGSFFGIFKFNIAKERIDTDPPFYLDNFKYRPPFKLNFPKSDFPFPRIKTINTYYRPWDSTVEKAAAVAIHKKVKVTLFDKKTEAYLLNPTTDTELVFDTVSNEELNTLIQKTFGRVDLMVMMNCYMQNLHTNYALRNTVSVLVAPQGDIEPPGFDFKSMLNKLATGPQSTAKSIARHLINASVRMGARQRMLGLSTNPFIVDVISLFATRPAYSKTVNRIIEDIVNYLLPKLVGVARQEWSERMQIARRVCMTFDTVLPYSSADLYCWLIELKQGSLPTEEEPLVDTLIEKLQSWSLKYIIENYCGSQFTAYASSYSGDVNVLPLACSIYFPSTKAEKEGQSGYKQAKETELMKKNRWIEFINRLYA